MLEKLARQTAVYGISTIVVRFLGYLLTPYYTRIFGTETYGIVSDIYSLIPLALTLLTMGMESSYFRFSAKAEEAGGDVAAAKRRLFATTWGATSLAALLFFVAAVVWRDAASHALGEAYVAHPEYAVWVAAIILFDVWSCIPFSRLREQGRSLTFVGFKLMNVVLNVTLAVGFGLAGLYATPFGVGWVFVANFAASAATWLAILTTAGRTVPRLSLPVLRAVFAYSLPLLVSGLAGTASEFIDRQMIKYLVPHEAMSQVGIYGAITKIAVVMMLFYQVEPYAREGIYILPVVLGANVLAGVWLNLSFWYKREERTRLAILITGTGLAATLLAGTTLVPRWGYYGAAWARLAGEASMVAVSWWLNRRFFPTPYDWRRIGEYAVVALGVFFLCEEATALIDNKWLARAFALTAFCGYGFYAVRRERIDLRALLRSALRRG